MHLSREQLGRIFYFAAPVHTVLLANIAGDVADGVIAMVT